jgi:3-methyladenine DNA glycosylase/8-oxoguanine DNA glycosylase
MKRTRTIILDQGDPERKRAEILAYFHATCDLDEKLYEVLRRNESFTLRADRLRHPLIFNKDTFVVRQSRRVFQHGVAEVTIWERT